MGSDARLRAFYLKVEFDTEKNIALIHARFSLRAGLREFTK